MTHPRGKEVRAFRVVACVAAHFSSKGFWLDCHVDVTRVIVQGAPGIWCEAFYFLFRAVVEVDGHESCRLITVRAAASTSTSQEIDALSVGGPAPALLHVCVAEEIEDLCAGLCVSWQARLKHIPEVLIILELIRVMANYCDVVAPCSLRALVQNFGGCFFDACQGLA